MTRYAPMAVALLLALTPAAPLGAQTAPDPAPTQPVAVATVPSVADLQALNFYLQQQDLASADAELRRLRAAFPGWTPPEDLSKLAVTQPSTEIDTIYRQIAAGQLTEARATIAATQADYANWVVPADMITLLETAEGQIRLDAALDAGNATEALQIASSTDGLLRCDRVNNAWRIAKAQEAQQAFAAATGTYRAILGACTSFADIAATLEKADTVTTEAELAALFDTALTRFPDKLTELTALQTRLLLGRGVAPAQIAILPDVTARPRPRPTEAAAAAPAVADPGSPPPAPAPAPAPESGSGSAPQAATSGTSGVQCLAATEGARSASRQAERGWCAYNLDRPMEALAAFSSAESRLGGAARRDARFGMALSYLKMNMTEEASRIAATTDLTHQQRVDTESQILDQRGVRAYQKRQYRKAIGYFDALEEVSGKLRRDLALLRGYAYLNSGNRARARAEFQKLHDQLATPETRKALAAASG